MHHRHTPLRLPQPLPAPVPRGILLVTLGSLLGTGCYRDVPTPLDQIVPGSSVRARIVVDPTGVSLVRNPAAEPIARAQAVIQGTLLEQDGERVRFLIPASRTAATLAYAPVHQEISVARRDVLSIDLRRLDGKRSAGLAAAIAGAVVAAFLTTSTVVGGTTPGTPSSGDVSVTGTLPASCCR